MTDLGNTELLDKLGVPHSNGQPDYDLWVKKFNAVINEGELIKSNKRCIAISPGYGAGWSTRYNISAVDAYFNLMLLSAVEHFPITTRIVTHLKRWKTLYPNSMALSLVLNQKKALYMQEDYST